MPLIIEFPMDSEKEIKNIENDDFFKLDYQCLENTYKRQSLKFKKICFDNFPNIKSKSFGGSFKKSSLYLICHGSNDGTNFFQKRPENKSWKNFTGKTIYGNAWLVNMSLWKEPEFPEKGNTHRIFNINGKEIKQECVINRSLIHNIPYNILSLIFKDYKYINNQKFL